MPRYMLDTDTCSYIMKRSNQAVVTRLLAVPVTAYAHNEVLTVKRGQTIKRGEVIARSGQTGNVKSPQLHFEIRKGTQSLDPRKYLVAMN